MTDWNALVLEHSRMVFAVAYRILGSVHDAEDAAQEAFGEAYALDRTQKVRSYEAVLRRLATFRALDRLRRRRAHVPLSDHPSDRGNPSHDAIARELADRLRSAIGELPDQQAAVFTLAFFDGSSRDEIAASLGISPAAVSTALFKARKKLQVLLTGVSQEVSDE